MNSRNQKASSSSSTAPVRSESISREADANNRAAAGRNGQATTERDDIRSAIEKHICDAVSEASALAVFHAFSPKKLPGEKVAREYHPAAQKVIDNAVDRIVETVETREVAVGAE